MFAQFKTLPQLFDFFKDNETCMTYWENIHWGKTGIVCPHCKAGNPYKTNRGYKCKSVDCQKKFTALVGTIFENTKLPLRTWFGAIYLISNHKKGISSLQLSRDLGIHQSSAWFLLHRLRKTFTERTPEKLGGEGVIVETDTTYVGGKVTNMSKDKRRNMKAYPWHNKWDNKSVVTGYVERGGTLRFDVKDANENVPDLLVKHVDNGTFLMTDDTRIYNKVAREICSGHEQVNHSNEEYVRDGYIHTNTIEGAFSMFDRMYVGTYHYISPKHMQAYANECAYRYNTRKAHGTARFEDTVLKCSGVRLKYNQLIGK